MVAAQEQASDMERTGLILPAAIQVNGTERHA